MELIPFLSPPPLPQLVAKAVRDMLRSSYTNLNEDAGNITETLKGLVGGGGL